MQASPKPKASWAPNGPRFSAEPPSAEAPEPQPPVERIAVVVNGNAKHVNDEVIGTLDQILSAGDLFISRRIEEGRHIARTIVERGYGTVLMGGGDGTFTVMVSDVVREARRQKKVPPRFGLLRLGTGNALAWVVGAAHVRKSGLKADIERLRDDAGSRPMRFIEVEGYLAAFCGFGLDAQVLTDYNSIRRAVARGPLRRVASGAMGYFVAITARSLPSMMLRPVPHVCVINRGADAYRIGERGSIVGPPIRAGEVIYEGRARFASVSTIPYYGFGVRCFPFADERPDRMNLRLSMLGALDLVGNFRSIWRGEFENLELLFDYLVDDVVVQVDPETEFQIGGDPHGRRREVRMRLSPEPIRLVDFYAPPRT